MSKKKKIEMASLAVVGTMAIMGYKYMKKHPEVKQNMNNMAKSATKRIYDMLDEMDMD